MGIVSVVGICLNLTKIVPLVVEMSWVAHVEHVLVRTGQPSDENAPRVRFDEFAISHRNYHPDLAYHHDLTGDICTSRVSDTDGVRAARIDFARLRAPRGR